MSERAGPRAPGLVILALGIACLLGTFAINDTGDGYAPEGAKLAPLIGSIALMVLGVLCTLRPAPAAEDEWELRTPAMLIGLLAGYAALLSTLGYALATTIFVWLTAWLLGSEKPQRDVIVGLGIGIVTSLVFSRLLGVRLPEGPWGF